MDRIKFKKMMKQVKEAAQLLSKVRRLIIYTSQVIFNNVCVQLPMTHFFYRCHLWLHGPDTEESIRTLPSVFTVMWQVGGREDTNIVLFPAAKPRSRSMDHLFGVGGGV